MARRRSARVFRALALAQLTVAAVATGVLGQSSEDPHAHRTPRSDEVLPDPYRDPELAARALVVLIAGQPDRYDLRIAAARELTALGVLAATKDQRAHRFQEAAVQARAAIALDSARVDGHYWLAAALGLEADEAGGLSKITLARQAYAQTLTTLSIEPDHGGGHHILGRLHAGVMRLGRINRLIARSIGLGAILSQASWESAELNLRRGEENDPDQWVHAVELAKLLVRLDRPAEARIVLEDVAARGPRHALDVRYQEDARKLLATMKPEPD